MYRAHSTNKCTGEEDPVGKHLRSVAHRAAAYADPLGAADEARLAGLLHDLGKYGDLFQKRLRGEAHHIDHWSVGAWAAITKGKTLGAALAVQGHHAGLQQAYKDQVNDLLRWVQQTPQDKRDNVSLSDANTQALWSRFEEDGLSLPSVRQGIYPQWSTTAAAMLDVRMLFSALVDADFIETERHFKGRYREEGLQLKAENALKALTRYVTRLPRTASDDVLAVRDDLRCACLDAAAQQPGLFTLTAPTGSGKTLAMLAFALKHAVEHGLRRVVVVIPYLTIIDQTAKRYREVFASPGEDQVERDVLEDHSMAGTRTEGLRGKAGEEDAEDEPRRVARLLAQNWDAPIVVTTSVQMLESLFANRPGPCRKLHRLAKSVILFDEVQTLPLKLALPTLATLSHLSARYGATVVFSTATQPAFRELDTQVRKLAPSGWNPREIVPPEVDLFKRVKRTMAVWPKSGEKTTWDDLADRLRSTEDHRALCIVNLRPHARTLYCKIRKLLGSKTNGELFHLSTYMCPAHRKVVLDAVKARLENRQPCILVSTQCVEAGVDLDFPAVFRAFAPLDAIAQAAGRCNRNGTAKEEGIVTVFTPDVDDKRRYPDGAYEQGANATEALVYEASGDLDINDPSVYERYYKALYSLRDLEGEGKELGNDIQGQNFVEVAEKYRLIPHDSVNVVVPYDAEKYSALKQEAEENGLTGDWMRRARPYAVGVFRSRRDDVPFLDPVPIHPGSNEKSDEWFLYLNEKDYKDDLGLVLPDTTTLMA